MSSPTNIRRWQVDLRDPLNMYNDKSTNRLSNNPWSGKPTSQFSSEASKKITDHRMAKKAMMAEAGVIESQPGIIESTNIAPLNKMTQGLPTYPLIAIGNLIHG